jgi:hypothetical protein
MIHAETGNCSQRALLEGGTECRGCFGGSYFFRMMVQMTGDRVTTVAKLIAISSAAFVFDLLEQYRPLGEQKVLEFIKGHVFDPADFSIRSDGVCRLNPEMAKHIASVVAGHAL